MPVTLDKPPEPTGFRRYVIELRRRFASALTRAAIIEPSARYDLLRRLDALLLDFEPQLADSLSAAIAGGWLAGGEASLDRLPLLPPLPSLGPLFAPPDKPPDLPTLLASSPDDQPRIELTALKHAAERLANRRVVSPPGAGCGSRD